MYEKCKKDLKKTEKEIRKFKELAPNAEDSDVERSNTAAGQSEATYVF